MSDDKVYVIILSLIGFLFGCITLCRIFSVVRLLYKNSCGKKDDKSENDCPYYCKVLGTSLEKGLVSILLEKRNEFWLYYGQILIAVVIAIILAVLMLTKTIDASAGLPLLSALGGFTIAKSTNSKHFQDKQDSDKRAGD